ncbi:MAG: gluconate 5-dehydrogenase [Mycobacterium sp.]|nr:gluconate 5-dehydrogenase [Mycobacterium sp.]
MSPLFDLSGRTALVTGAGSGIGFAIAQGLAQAGARVVVNGRDEAKAVAAARRLGADTRVCCFDVTDESAIQAGIDSLAADGVVIDILVNNAGIQRRGPLTGLDRADWDAVLAGDLTSVFLVGRAVATQMIGRGAAGKIINIASLAAHFTRPGVGPYTAAKGGVRALTQAMTAEWAPYGICVNALAPGHVRTDMTDTLSGDQHFDRWVTHRTPAGRWGVPDDLKGPAVFLASAASDYVTGQILYVDGGTAATM